MLDFSRILIALTEVLGRDIRANDPRMSAGCPSQKLPLWADCSFLKFTINFKLTNKGMIWLGSDWGFVKGRSLDAQIAKSQPQRFRIAATWRDVEYQIVGPPTSQSYSSERN